MIDPGCCFGGTRAFYRFSLAIRGFMADDLLTTEAVELDGRVKDQRGKRAKQGPLGLMSTVHCYFCGKAGIMITEEWAESVFYVCNNDSCLKQSALAFPSNTQVPDEVVTGARKDPQAEAIRDLIRTGG